MSNYTDIRDALAGELSSVSGIGQVLKAQPYSTDWATYLGRFTITHPVDPMKKLICVAWLSRRNFAETETGGKGSRDEAETIVAVERNEIWEIVILVGYQDDDTNPSEKIFNELVDKVADKFRIIDPVSTLCALLEEAWPAQLESAAMFFFGEVLCHKAVMSIRLQQRLTS